MYKLRKKMISISIQSRMSYAAFDTTKNYDSFMGMFNDIIVVADPMRSKEGLWIKDPFEKSTCKRKRKMNWPCELMLKNVYE